MKNKLVISNKAKKNNLIFSLTRFLSIKKRPKYKDIPPQIIDHYSSQDIQKVLIYFIKLMQYRLQISPIKLKF